MRWNLRWWSMALPVAVLSLAGGNGVAAEKRKPVKPAAAQPAKPSVAKPTAPMPSDLPVPDEPARAEAQKRYDAAVLIFQKGDFAGARSGFQSVLEVSPGNAPALINLALIEQRQGQFENAERRLRQVLHDDPGSASAWLLLGMGAYEQGKLDAAHAHLAQAVLYAPKNAQAHQFLGVVLGRKGWYSAGEEELRRSLEIDPKIADTHYNLAVLYLERIPPAVELARRHYQKALELGAKPDPELVKKLDATP